MQYRQFISTGWTVRAVDGLEHVPADVLDRDIPATVPGCIHTDLLNAGLIDDPYYDRNEIDVQWISDVTWRYSCRFAVDADLRDTSRLDVLCEGLDTVATVALNGTTLGWSNNMRVPCRLDARTALVDDDNELTITFAPARQYAEQMERQMGYLPRGGGGINDPGPHNFIRKTACNFGWDWGPVLMTCGIWQPVCLQGWETALIRHVRPLVRRADAETGRLEVYVDVLRDYESLLDIEAVLHHPNGQLTQTTGVVIAGESTGRVVLQVDRPDLWWPVGHGDQPLYDLEVSLSQAGRALDQWQGRTAFRTVELDTTPDANGEGSAFAIKVNGKSIYSKGANWIPDDVFQNRVTPQRYRRRIEQALGANMNILRVWGGGLYETETFYRICDELGMMVWQDFLFACACYAETSPLIENIEAEVRHNVARLSHHPSLVLWNGCNENVWGYFVWTDKASGKIWKDALGDRDWGLGYYLRYLPQWLAEVDDSRPYWPASPYSGSMDIHPQAAEHGNRHVWEVWHGSKLDYYEQPCRFCSEFGFAGPANWATIEESIPPDQRHWHSDSMAHHQRSPQGHKVLASVREEFDEPEDFAGMHYLGQLMQARMLRRGVEFYRSLAPWNMGTIYWQLNDCWPGCTYSAIDGSGRLKPLWYATRRFYAPRLLTIQPRGSQLLLVAHNDSDEIWQDSLDLRRLGFCGDIVARRDMDFCVPPRTCASLGPIGDELLVGDESGEFIVAQTSDELADPAMWFFVPDKQLRYPRPDFQASLSPTDEGYALTIDAAVLLRDVVIQVDRLDPQAELSDQLVTFLPGQRRVLRVTSKAKLDLDQLITPSVFCCANDFGGQ